MRGGPGQGGKGGARRGAASELLICTEKRDVPPSLAVALLLRPECAGVLQRLGRAIWRDPLTALGNGKLVLGN